MLSVSCFRFLLSSCLWLIQTSRPWCRPVHTVVLLLSWCSTSLQQHLQPVAAATSQKGQVRLLLLLLSQACTLCWPPCLLSFLMSCRFVWCLRRWTDHLWDAHVSNVMFLSKFVRDWCLFRCLDRKMSYSGIVFVNICARSCLQTALLSVSVA